MIPSSPIMKILAPVCSVAEAEAAIAAGADELYIGVMFDPWVEQYGDADLLSRRQGRAAHLRSVSELSAVAGLGVANKHPVALALNARYTAGQIPALLEACGLWEEAGGSAIIVADIGLLLALKNRHSRLERHLSILAGVFNSQSVAFFEAIGVRRVVLPRELNVEEMAAITSRSSRLDFEVVTIYQKCRFIDGMCGFHHAPTLPSGVPAEFDYVSVPDSRVPIVWSADPGYEGHGCQLKWRCRGLPVELGCHNDFQAPPCAACLIPALQDARVTCLKIAGRGYGSEAIVRAIRFLRAAIHISATENPATAREHVRRTYADTFGASCRSLNCYYSR